MQIYIYIYILIIQKINLKSDCPFDLNSTYGQVKIMSKERPPSSPGPSQGLPPPPDVRPRRNNIRVPTPILDTSNELKSLASSSEMRSKTTLFKANSMDTKDSKLVCAMGKSKDRMSLPAIRTNSPSHHPDLEGLDFSNLASPDTFASADSQLMMQSSSSSEDLKGKEKASYPDIRHAFSGLHSQQSVFPASKKIDTFGALNSSPFPPPGSLTQATSFQSSHSPNVQPGSATNFITTNSFFPPSAGFVPSQTSFIPSQHNNGMQRQNSFSKQDDAFIVNTQGSVAPNTLSNVLSSRYSPVNTAALSGNSINNFSEASSMSIFPNPLSLSYIPNIQRAGSSSSGEVEMARDASQSPIENSMNNPMAVAGFDSNMTLPLNIDNPSEDLICLGPPALEHEYLSLDFFDPLYSKARQESFSITSTHQRRMSTASTFSFGEAFPNVPTPEKSLESIESLDQYLEDLPNANSSVDDGRRREFIEPSEFDFFDFRAHREEDVAIETEQNDSLANTATTFQTICHKKGNQRAPQQPSLKENGVTVKVGL